MKQANGNKIFGVQTRHKITTKMMEDKIGQPYSEADRAI